MAKATITLPDGTKMTVEGSAAEIMELVRKMQGSSDPTRKTPTRTAEKRQRLRLVDHLESLIDKKFFQTPRGLSDVRDKLREMGHHYPLTTLSPAMLNKVRQRALRRMKDAKSGNRWKYVQ
jgi:tRNA C32,U32 (ribose-2'-O)-methylase TrmJ